MHIALIGATGLVGSHILKRLLNNDKILKVTVLTRQKINSPSQKLFQLILKNMTPALIEKQDLKADIYFCGLGTTIKIAGSQKAFQFVDHDLVLAFAKLAQKSEAKALFIVSALGANQNSKFFYNQVKGQMEASVKTLGLKSLYFLRPSILIGKRQKKRIGEEIGICFYKLVEQIIPKKITQKLGSRVSDIVTYVEDEVFNIKPGAHIVAEF